MTSTLNHYYENMTISNLKKQLDFLKEQYEEANDQWKLHCDFMKKGFDHLPEWEQETANKGGNDRRQFWFMQKEITYNNWNEFSKFLDEKNFWSNL
ncbi:hypothetical protein [uncultured Mediterranean phage uvDeep-CGR2-KM19-C269]|nr:hypothetical protein [uncultured Mediterranean phage uvDeep-CGR2-KM19-C269]